MLHTFFTRKSLRTALLVALALLFAGPAHAGEFRYDAATQTIRMTGKIVASDWQTFSALLRAHPETRTIALSSSVGGEYTSSLAISLEVKRRRLNTVSSNYCHSGCAYIWLAGATRSVVGSVVPKIHLPYANATGETYPGLVYDWFDKLGFSSSFADAVVRSVGPDNTFVQLTPRFLKTAGVAI